MERKLLLLGLLRRQGMHGYQLYEFIERDLAVCTDLKKPSAYYLLGKMAADGWVNEEEIQEGNRPPRRVYNLTPQGEAAYQHLLRENLSTFAPTYFPGDIGLALIDSLPVEEALPLLQQRRQALLDQLESARAVPSHQGSLQLVVEHQVRHLSGELDWIDQVIQRLADPA